MTEPTYQKLGDEPAPAPEQVAFEFCSVEKPEAAEAVPVEGTAIVVDRSIPSTVVDYIPACISTYFCGLLGVVCTLMFCPSNHGKSGAATGCAVLFLKVMIFSIVGLVVVSHTHTPSFEATGIDQPTCEAYGGHWLAENDEHPHDFMARRQQQALWGGHHGRHHHRGGHHHHGGDHWHGHKGQPTPEVAEYVKQKLVNYVAEHPEDMEMVGIAAMDYNQRRAYMHEHEDALRRFREIVDFEHAPFHRDNTDKPQRDTSAEENQGGIAVVIEVEESEGACMCPAYFIEIERDGAVFCERSRTYWATLLAFATVLVAGFLYLRAHYLRKADAQVTITVSEVQPAYPTEGIIVADVEMQKQ